MESLSKRPMKLCLCSFAFHKHDFQSIYEHLTVGLEFDGRIIHGKVFPTVNMCLSINKQDNSSQKCLRAGWISQDLVWHKVKEGHF